MLLLNIETVRAAASGIPSVTIRVSPIDENVRVCEHKGQTIQSASADMKQRHLGEQTYEERRSVGSDRGFGVPVPTLVFLP